MTQPSRLLVVEDDPDVRVTLCDVLEASGYEPIEAPNGNRALEILQSGDRIDAILLDLGMPGMDGIALRDQQRKDDRLSRIPVIVMSGRGQHETADAGLEPAAYLQKPFDMQTLLDVLERVLGRR